MTKERNRNDSPLPRGMTRRRFVKLAVAGLLVGCRSAQQPTVSATPTSPPPPSATPTNAPTAAATPTSAPTASAAPTSVPTAAATPTGAPTASATPTSAPTATATPTSAPTASATPTSAPTASATPTSAPAALSGVVHTHHAGVWADEALVPQAIRHMLDASITELTGLNDAKAAWASLFSPDERIAIKVNTIRSSSFWTHAPLVMAVTELLQETGVPAEQIVIFDRLTRELEWAGYPVNEDGPGVRCYGTDGHYTAGWTIMDIDIGLSDILLNSDALINIPILKQHDLSGISFAMKNHYGTFDKPGSLHPRIERAMPELNALQAIQDRTRLIIGDALTVVKQGWYSAVTGDSILLSFDPVAHDMIGLQLYSKTLFPDRDLAETPASRAIQWLENGANLGLGTHDPHYIELAELDLA